MNFKEDCLWINPLWNPNLKDGPIVKSKPKGWIHCEIQTSKLRGGPPLSPTPPPACSHRELILPLKEMFESYAAAKKAIDLI